jgi:hypothetical protein
MPRPLKYATAKEAAEASLYSKVGGAHTGLSLEEFVELATSKCTVCGSDPDMELVMVRAKDSHLLKWNHITEGKPVCSMCRRLTQEYGIEEILSHCARIMAKRMHDKRRAKSKDINFADMASMTAGAGREERFHKARINH